jgi:hypothetical protein
MNIDNNKIYKFLAGGMVSTLSVVVSAFMALYLSKLDDGIGRACGNGVFAVQTAFSAGEFSALRGAFVPHLGLVNQYLAVDVIFTLSCAVCFPAVMALMFTQYKEIMRRLNDTDCSPSQYKARDRFIFFAPISMIFCVICNGLVYYMLNTGKISGVLTMIAGVSQIMRVLLLFGALGFILYILIKRRKHIKQLYSQG